MTKIALICDPPVYGGGGGVYSYCLSLKELLEKSGMFSVSLFSDFKYKNYFGLHIFSLKELETELINGQFDYIHINGFMTFLPYQIFRLIKKKKIGVPLIYTPHAHPFNTLRHPFRNRIFYYCFISKVIRKSNKVICNNNEDYNYFSRKTKYAKKIVEWYTISPEILKQKKNGNTLLFVGRNDDNKRLDFLYCLPKNKYKVVCVTNKKPERDDFIFLHDLSKEELINEYKNADLLVVPSKYESFSLVSLESLCVGTPVLLSDKCRIIDWLRNTSGFSVFEYDNKKDFLSKIDETMKKNVDVDYIKTVFSSETALKQYMDTIYCN